MRLLNTTKRKLEEFGGNKIPPYAILSHTWGDREITFRDIEGDDAEKKVEYEKVRNTCNIAAAHGFDYVWIDTCCIDKTSSAELSEAINSMYRWYQDSTVCYAYLSDMSPNAIYQKIGATSPEFSKSRWFTRGWTLQELIAPSIIIFLDQKWQEIGTKSGLQQMISEITGIPTNILLGGNLEDASVAQRMSWVSKRTTTRVEDLAYCLLGIFNINMPMLYGEGERAFTRLQEEIMKISDDHSLFAWKSSEQHGSLLATSPAAFFESWDIVPSNSSNTLSGAITVNNKGIHLKLNFRPFFQDVGLAILPCTKNGEKVAICLKAMSETNEYFIRTMSDRLELLVTQGLRQSEYPEKSMCVQQERRIRKNQLSLLSAVANRHKVLMELLLEKGAGLETSDEYDGQMPLLWAVKNGHEEVVELLFEKGAEVETKDKSGLTSLWWAVKNGHEEVVKLLLEKGAEVETKDKSGLTSLWWAVKNGHEAVVKLLLEKGAKVETGSEMPPLSCAAESGHEAIVKLLLEKGAKLETKDLSSFTPLLYAARNRHEAVVKLLLKKGAKVETKSRSGHTPLSWAAESGHEAIVKLLLEKDAKVDTNSKYGQKPLLCAARNGREVVVNLLLEKGVKLESKEKSGYTPLLWAAKNGHEEVVNLLLEKGAKLESKEKSGYTPLLWAAKNGHEEVVNLLLEKGAEVETKDRTGLTPLSWAERNGHEAVVKLLRKKGDKVNTQK